MKILGLLVVTVALLAAGCTSSAPDKVVATPTTHATPAKPIDPATAAVLKLGKDIPILAKLPSAIGKQHTDFLGVASTNIVFGTMTKPAKGKTPAQAHPILYNTQSRSTIRLDDGLERATKTQILGMVSSQATIVWVESSGSGAVDGDLVVYTYERTSGARRIRTLDPVPGDGLVYGDDLTVADSRILLSMASTDAAAGSGAAIYSGSIASGKPLKALVDDGQRLTVDGDRMTYSVGTKKFVRDLDSGDTKAAPVSSHANDATFCGAEFIGVFTIRCDNGSDSTGGATLTVTNPGSHSTTVGPFVKTPPNDIRMVGPWLDIGSTDGRVRGQEYLLSPGSKSLKALPEGTTLVSGIAPDLAPDLALLSQPGKELRQWLVHIPSS